MNLSPAEISQVLLDVRKAYRLLHDYQRMALDAANYIGKQLGLTYVGGWPKFSEASPRKGKGGLDWWSWDWLNLGSSRIVVGGEGKLWRGIGRQV